MAYNLYLIHHNLPADNKTDRLCQRLIKRLKDPDHFWGALYETYALSIFAVAGFSIELEDESDRSTTHCEFNARAKNGRVYAIECKARNRTFVPVSADGTPRIDAESLGIGRKLKDALSKTTPHERVVFIDLDIPLITLPQQFETVASVAASKLRELEATLQANGQPAPPAYVLVTNIPDHRNIGDLSVGFQAVSLGYKIADFGHGVAHLGMHALVNSRERHANILSLLAAAKIRQTVPSTFDGSNPALAFSRDQIPRLLVGNWYMIPDGRGGEVEARLCQVEVIRDEKTAYGVYQTKAGHHLICTNILTDDEIRAYDLHPDTLFGVVQDVNHKAETVVELFDFFFETYQNSSKEKLLEFMAGAPDLALLQNMTQRDLAIAYCERLAVSHFSNNRGPKAA
jgi:hypothetical protein